MNPVLVTILAAVVLASAPALAAEPAASTPVQVRLVKAAAGSEAASAWAAATIAAARRATLSTRLSATVREVLADEGTQVQAGQLVVRLSGDDVRAQLAAARAALQSAAAHERRIRALAAERAATASELEAAEAQRAQAEAAVAGAQASLGYTELRAPFAGTVQARRVSAGDLVGPGQPLLELEGSALELQASLSEAEARGLSIGRRLRFEAGERRGEVRITALTPGGDPLSLRRFLRAQVTGGGAGLRSGTFARVELPGVRAETQAAWVPKSAVVERGDLTGVFVAENGHALLRWVALGEPAGGRYPVRAGLAPAEAVIDAPGALRDGQAVEVARGE
jgi:membrane fusion protein, multidrug efflux system